MLRITQSESAAAALSYFEDCLTRGDYYLEGQEVSGAWGGRGAERLGLRGEVEKEAFGRLLENLRPDGEPLTARTIGNRRPGYDFTFDVPKSVSLLHLVSGDERIADAMRRAIAETMRELEEEMHARVRKDGAFSDRKTGNMIFADFMHFTSRPTLLPSDVERAFLAANPWMKKFKDGKGRLCIPDPHLHVHVYVINATFDAVEKIWKAGEFMRIKRDASYYQAAFHTRLAAELQKLGYAIQPTAKAFEISGVPRDVIELFSRRTKEVEEAAKRLGITDDRRKDGLGAMTRRAKVPELGMKQLKQVWRGLLPAATTASLDGLVKHAKAMGPVIARDDRAMASEGIRYAIGHELERVSTVSRLRLMARALVRTVGHTSVDTVRSMLSANPEVISGDIGDQNLLTTREILAEESALFQLVRGGRGQCLPLIFGKWKFQTPALKTEENSTREQRAAVDHLLRAEDWILGVVGRAGTGKTTLLMEMDAALRSVGKKLIVCAPTAEAARGVLRGEGFADAETVKQLITDSRMHARLRGSVLWLDEAGLLGNRDMLALLRLAKEHGAERVILAGDSRQIRSVPRGDAFLFLEKKAGLNVARLNAVRRQNTPQLRETVEAMSEGDMAAGFATLEKSKRIHEGTIAKNSNAIAQSYADKVSEKTRLGRQKTALVISPTHAEGEKVTEAIRAELRARKIIGQKEHLVTRTINLSWTEKQKEVAANYELGLVVQFKQNSRGFRKSERVRVSDVDARAGRVIVKTNAGEVVDLPLEEAAKWQVYAMRELPVAVGDHIKITENGYDKSEKYRMTNGDLLRVDGFTNEGEIILSSKRVLPRDFGHLTHGYVITADSAQAKTVDAVYLSVSSDSFGATDMRRIYVMVSRAREEAHIYTDDKDGLLRAAQRDTVRHNATDLVNKQSPREALRRLQVGELPQSYTFPQPRREVPARKPEREKEKVRAPEVDL